MKSKKVVVGSTAVFECIFTGNPKPKVEWFKNNTRIAKGKNGRFNVNDQLLIILGVQFDDAGTYSCRVSNALGMKQQIAKLAVVSGMLMFFSLTILLSFVLFTSISLDSLALWVAVG